MKIYTQKINQVASKTETTTLNKFEMILFLISFPLMRGFSYGKFKRKY